MSETPPMVHRSFVHQGRLDGYDVEALTVSDMAMSALSYVDVRAANFNEFDAFREAQERANRFANFCVAETIDDSGRWCDPTRSFRDLWERFITSDHA